MLTPETPFPYPGSYALYVDPDAAAPQAAELVRIQWRAINAVAVSFPLRAGASGNKSVPAADLIDTTPLTAAETREFHDLDLHLGGRSIRTPKQKRDMARRDALRERMIYGPIMDRLMRFMRQRDQQQEAA